MIIRVRTILKLLLLESQTLFLHNLSVHFESLRNVYNVDETLRACDIYLTIYSNFSILVGHTKRFSFKCGTHTMKSNIFMPK